LSVLDWRCWRRGGLAGRIYVGVNWQVLEETGFDISSRIIEDDSIEVQLGQQRSRLFIVTGVDEATHFAPLVRKEISSIKWHRVADLPTPEEEGSKVSGGG
jgi:hypothetical protein